jgi:hypothetical protein
VSHQSRDPHRFSPSTGYPGKCLHHKGSILWYKYLSNLSGVLGLLDLELPEVELDISTVHVKIEILTSNSLPSRMCPSARPLCPGREVMAANNRPALNCCSRRGSTLASFFRSSRIRLTWLDCLTSAAASSPVDFSPRVTGWAYWLLAMLMCRRRWVTYVSLVPLSEGGSVNVDNTRLDKGLGSEKLVVGGVVSL